MSNSQQQQINFLGLFKANAQQPEAPKKEEEVAIGFNTRGVYADGRLNAILVRDKISYFETYKQIIALLDRPTDMVQLDAMIVDFNQSKALQYGITWGYGDSSLGGAGASIVLGGASAAKLLANIKASQDNGDSKTVSTPSIVTLNNVEATFSSTENQFVKVAGNLDASLNKVSAETALRVTPLIANESPDVPYDERRVKLLVNVQDGSFDPATKQGDARTKQSQITTQAVVRSGDVLVIGGHVVRRIADTSSGIPGLSSIPLIGGLFGQKGEVYEEFVRIYVVRTQILGEDSFSAKTVAPLSAKAQEALK